MKTQKFKLNSEKNAIAHKQLWKAISEENQSKLLGGIKVKFTRTKPNLIRPDQQRR
ncbi:hypothetical protein [Calothrix rhizosoleniae]|uniref:hypothetical protein n=1 Tax=Calothrix rhizosoleniae TaxID=888997 RepID=UPI00135641FB|nr:hypothetical protein [Calothrix rhizosoleniae]